MDTPIHCPAYLRTRPPGLVIFHGPRAGTYELPGRGRCLPVGLRCPLIAQAATHWYGPIPEPRCLPPCRVDSPRSWVPLEHRRDECTSEVAGVENGDSCQTGGPDTDGSRRCDDTRECQDQEVPPGIRRSIRPGAPCPETVLVVVMSDGSYLLVGYPQGVPAAFAAGEDADLLRQALQAAFGYPTDDAGSGNGNSNGTAVPENRALRIKKAQP